ncbi:MAG: type II 3-dehydroquinate dehydratase [Myxococcaceae bacterium]
MRILVLHGPNLNLLGEREGDEKGRTLNELNALISQCASELGLEVKILQSNHEGVLVDTLHAERRWADGIVINPGALTHSSYVLREAIHAVGKPALEVHLTDIRRRESWRRMSVIKDVCEAQVLGKGFDSYLIALTRFAEGDLSGRRRRARTAAAARKQQHTEAVTEATFTPISSAVQVTKSSSRGEEDAKSGGRLEAGSGAKTLGRADVSRSTHRGPAGISRGLVREKISERLGGHLSPAGLATWARSQYLEVQRGAPAEVGHRELIEETLQTLVLSSVPSSKLTDDELIDLMTQLGE